MLASRKQKKNVDIFPTNTTTYTLLNTSILLEHLCYKLQHNYKWWIMFNQPSEIFIEVVIKKIQENDINIDYLPEGATGCIVSEDDGCAQLTSWEPWGSYCEILRTIVGMHLRLLRNPSMAIRHQWSIYCVYNNGIWSEGRLLELSLVF